MSDSGRDAHVAVSVIIATYNRAALVRAALEALRGQVTPPDLRWEIVVVDNNSTDDTRVAVEGLARGMAIPLRYLFEPRQGKSRALNSGLRVARGSVVAFTDDDALAAPDWVATAARVLDLWQADAAGGRILPHWEAPAPDWLMESPRLLHLLGLMEHGRAATMSLPVPFEPQIWGPNMVVRRAALESVGGFDERRGPVGSRRFTDEDTEMVRRLLGSGYRIVYDPGLTVHHRVPAARLRRDYFRRLEWDAGLGSAVGVVEPGPFLLGAPRWRYRRGAAALARWSSHLVTGSPDVVEAELEVIQCAAAICSGLAHHPWVRTLRHVRGIPFRRPSRAGVS